MDTDRNLLFGVLAFQKGAIDADGLAETWAPAQGGAAVKLADRLVDQGLLTIEQKTELEQVLDQELKAHGGDAQATLAATVDMRCREALSKVPQLDATINA